MLRLLTQLPKWTDCVVYGEPVSPEKAAEAIFRCMGGMPRGNENKWNKLVHSTMGCSAIARERDWAKREKREEAWLRSLGVLELKYLGLHSRITSTWVGGPHGWMHWDGTVAFRGPIGKWPDSTSVRKEWERIAEALPWLRLSCVLWDTTDAVMGDEDWKVEEVEPLMGYAVAGGEAEMFAPNRKWAEQIYNAATEAERPALLRRARFEEHVHATAENDRATAQRLVFESERGLTEQELRERWTAFRANAA